KDSLKPPPTAPLSRATTRCTPEWGPKAIGPHWRPMNCRGGSDPAIRSTLRQSSTLPSSTERTHLAATRRDHETWNARRIAATQRVLDPLLHSLLDPACGLVVLRVDCATSRAPSTSCWALAGAIAVVLVRVVVQQPQPPRSPRVHVLGKP
ncbi:hypothetical protein BC828DRAFT_424963, partial [Blastocladiella britannica]